MGVFMKRNNEVTNYEIVEVLKPLTSAEIISFISEGKADQVAAHLENYNKQKDNLKNNGKQTGRLSVKKNKAGGLYVAHPSFSQSKGGLNFPAFLLPAVEALVYSDEFRGLVKSWFEDESLSIDKTYMF